MEIFGQISPLLVLAMIAGLTQFAKKFGAEGNVLLVISMVLGVTFGMLYQVAQLYPAVNPWFGMVVFGVLFGLTASGLYDLGKQYTNTSK